ncbi:E3 ubiquitin-protein ligase RNF180 isoform X2 [Tachysurus fulvidraco]|uniref:E3 ubiquitin-protein ligase RNF180 isoform X2 n=1 Tax=Tachysurus fulvidraco TaxID=1234273 RepID=UPI001FEE2042|nr:E3 ubiquitin-protein ligase RNF180 isoform X2 [Tachysurus fulvidraco]
MNSGNQNEIIHTESLHTRATHRGASAELMAECTVWHMDVDALPDWVLSVVNQVHWTTGKLNCQHCGAHLGGFNFINCSRCPCGQNTTVHLVKSRVDQIVKHVVYLSRPSTARVRTGFQVKPRDLEGPEDRSLGHDPNQVTNELNSEPELLSRQIQPPHSNTSTQDTVTGQADISDAVTDEPQDNSCATPVWMLSKRERNRLKSLRRKQRKKELWLQKLLEEMSVSWIQTSSDEDEKESCMCAVCLDIYYKPYMCQPCSHVFCEPCLRMLAKSRESSTPCPLCRTLISHVIFQEELQQRIRSHFPKQYSMRNETFKKTNYSKLPLPSCPKRFHILWGLQGHRNSSGQWQFPLRTLGMHILELGDIRHWTFHTNIITFIFYLHLVFLLCGLFYILLW